LVFVVLLLLVLPLLKFTTHALLGLFALGADGIGPPLVRSRRGCLRPGVPAELLLDEPDRSF